MKTISAKHIPLLATAIVCLLLYAIAAIAYKNFFSAPVFLNFFSDNAVLGIAAIGMTFVILTGGIDLSVGSIIGLSSMVMATLMQKHSWPPMATVLFALAIGIAFGAGQGWLIQSFNMPPFLVTLAGMFLARGLCFMIQLESIPITQPFYDRIADTRLPLGGGLDVPMITLIYLAVVIVGIVIAQSTAFGRNIYAVGGNELSSFLMGLPIGRTRILTYAISGFCAALAGVVYTVYTFSGNPTAGTGLELDAIAAVVIGGTLLSGGVGYLAGTVLGVLILGIIQTAITFQGNLSSWWTKIAVGLLLLFFILLQKLIQNNKIKSWLARI